MNGIKLYSLTSEDLSGLGSMAHQETPVNWVKYYSSIPAAKKAAEKDYGNPIKWRGNCSGDLSYVMYTIEKVTIEVDPK